MPPDWSLFANWVLFLAQIQLVGANHCGFHLIFTSFTWVVWHLDRIGSDRLPVTSLM